MKTSFNAGSWPVNLRNRAHDKRRVNRHLVWRGARARATSVHPCVVRTSVLSVLIPYCRSRDICRSVAGVNTGSQSGTATARRRSLVICHAPRDASRAVALTDTATAPSRGATETEVRPSAAPGETLFVVQIGGLTLDGMFSVFAPGPLSLPALQSRHRSLASLPQAVGLVSIPVSHRSDGYPNFFPAPPKARARV